mgnify:CR=1 FL=1
MTYEHFMKMKILSVVNKAHTSSSQKTENDRYIKVKKKKITEHGLTDGF